MKPNVVGTPIELGAIGMISGAVIGIGLKSLWNRITHRQTSEDWNFSILV